MKKLFSIILIISLAAAAGWANEFSVSELAGNFAFVFRENDASTLRADFNEAILSMKLDGTMTILQTKYTAQDIWQIEPLHFRTYSKAKTIKVAMPDKTFSMAVIAEISRRLLINVELVNITTDWQTALASGQVDVIVLHKPEIDRSETYYVMATGSNFD